MPADLPPVAAVEHVVNHAAAKLGVTRPALLDTVNDLVAGTRVDADADACLDLDVADEARLALHTDVDT